MMYCTASLTHTVLSLECQHKGSSAPSFRSHPRRAGALPERWLCCRRRQLISMLPPPTLYPGALASRLQFSLLCILITAAKIELYVLWRLFH